MAAIIVFKSDLRTEGPHGHEVKIDGPLPYGTPAGKRDPGLSQPGQERTKDKDRGPHGLHQIVGRLVAGEGSGMDRHVPAAVRLRSQDGQEPSRRLHILQLRYVPDPVLSGGEKSSGHDGKRGVLGPAHLHFSLEPGSPVNHDPLHR
jgi:hypothetical protein